MTRIPVFHEPIMSSKLKSYFFNTPRSSKWDWDNRKKKKEGKNHINYRGWKRLPRLAGLHWNITLPSFKGRQKQIKIWFRLKQPWNPLSFQVLLLSFQCMVIKCHVSNQSRCQHSVNTTDHDVTVENSILTEHPKYSSTCRYKPHDFNTCTVLWDFSCFIQYLGKIYSVQFSRFLKSPPPAGSTEVATHPRKG